MYLNKNKLKEYTKKNLNDKKNGFSFFNGGNITLLSTCFGVQICYLLGDIENLEKTPIVNKIKESQSKGSGLFKDKNFIKGTTKNFSEEYLNWQFTYFSIIALDILGNKPVYTFSFLEKFKNERYLENWFNNQKFDNFWYTSNKMMFLLYFLIYEKIRMNINNEKIINKILFLLKKQQDPETGFWGTDKGSSLINGMYGAAHIYLYFDYFKEPINFKEVIIKNTLSLQTKYGLYGNRNGGACEDYNAIEIISILNKKNNISGKKMKNKIKKLYKILIHNQNKDGGFSYKIDNRSVLEKLEDKIKKRNHYYTYSGWDMMKSNVFKSDLWGTYFRLLTVAKIEKILKIENNYQFYELPGWGH